jgi:ABC-type siderophore export system fused ATPase/permease subunit
LEDRDVCIFDEWAADQDRSSRRKFYLEFLPALKRSGKLVVVLTHDEEFDGIADQIIRFGDGKVVAGPQGAESRESSLVTSHE